jgi:hypothetical protein
MANIHHPPEKDTVGGDTDLSDLLQELRVLIAGAQLLFAFLVILPFNSGFAQIREGERIIYAVAFGCTLFGLALLQAPAIHHRLHRPLTNREKFKNVATALVIAGIALITVALVLITHLVITQTLPEMPALHYIGPAVFALFLLAIWWVYPLRRPFDDENG